MKAITEMTTAEMITEYNALTGKAIKKFATRATGEKQLARARAFYATEEVATEEVATEEVATEEVATEEQAEEFDAPEEVWTAQAKAKVKKVKESTGNISDGVKASWKNAEVAAARAKRDAVAVEGKGEFKSVVAAFKALNLPMNKHIKFRIELKAKGSAKFGEYNFTIVR